MSDTHSFRMACPQCDAKLIWKQEYAGRNAICKTCSAKIRMPDEPIGSVLLNDTLSDLGKIPTRKRSYDYIGRNKEWQEVEGNINATSVEEAIRLLKIDGIKVKTIDGKNPYKGKWDNKNSMPKEKEDGLLESIKNHGAANIISAIIAGGISALILTGLICSLFSSLMRNLYEQAGYASKDKFWHITTTRGGHQTSTTKPYFEFLDNPTIDFLNFFTIVQVILFFILFIPFFKAFLDYDLYEKNE